MVSVPRQTPRSSLLSETRDWLIRILQDTDSLWTHLVMKSEECKQYNISTLTVLISASSESKIFSYIRSLLCVQFTDCEILNSYLLLSLSNVNEFESLTKQRLFLILIEFNVCFSIHIFPSSTKLINFPLKTVAMLILKQEPACLLSTLPLQHCCCPILLPLFNLISPAPLSQGQSKYLVEQYLQACAPDSC